jgi:hypothetical protein
MGNKLGIAFASAIAGGLLISGLGRRWGATEDEVHASLPGDDVIPHPMLETTHAVTIQAPASAVWPWLAQAGYRGAGRAGWYTDAAWDPILGKYILPLLAPAGDLPGNGIAPSVDRILPEFQQVAVGDIIPDGPPGTAWFTVREVKPGQALVLYSDSHTRYLTPPRLQGTRWASYGEFTWVFVLRPEGGGATRLILRTRARFGPRALRSIAPLPFYLADFVFARLLLRGVKTRAEHFVGRQAPAARASRPVKA